MKNGEKRNNMDEYKEYDLLPCPWCENPVHVELDTRVGYLVTCGNFYCGCPTKIYWPSEKEARYRWNCGDTFKMIAGGGIG